MGYENLTEEDLLDLANILDNIYLNNGSFYTPNLQILRIKRRYPDKIFEAAEGLPDLTGPSIKNLLDSFSRVHRLDEYLYQIPFDELPLYITEDNRSVKGAVAIWRLKHGF